MQEQIKLTADAVREKDELENKLDSKIKAAQAQFMDILIQMRAENANTEKRFDGEIKALKDTIKTRDDKIDAIEAQLESEQQARESSEIDLTAMRDQLAGLTKTNTTLAGEIADLKQKTGDERTRDRNQIAALANKLRDLELPLLFRQVILGIGQHVFDRVCAECEEAGKKAADAREAARKGGRNTFCTLTDLVDAGVYSGYVQKYLSDEDVALLKECKRKGNENAHRHPSLQEAQDFLANNTNTCDRAEMLFQYYRAYDAKRPK